MSGARGGIIISLIAGAFVLGLVGPSFAHGGGGNPETVIEGILAGHADCTTVALPADAGGKVFRLIGPDQPQSDYVITFIHASGAGVGLGPDLKRATADDRTVIDDLTGGGSEVIFTPTREVGRIPAGSTEASVCMKDTFASWDQHHRHQHFSAALDHEEEFELHVGGTLPPGFNMVEADVAAYPLLDHFVRGPMRPQSLPFEAGSVSFRNMEGYPIVSVSYSTTFGTQNIMMWACEDYDGDGTCSGTGRETVRGGRCMSGHPRVPDPLMFTTSGEGKNVLMAVATGIYEPVDTCAQAATGLI